MTHSFPQPRYNSSHYDQVLDDLVERFEENWHRGARPAINDFLNSVSNCQQRHALLVELVQVELERRHSIGEDVSVEEYLERFPDLALDVPAVVDLISADHTLRCQHNLAISWDDYLRRFPDLTEPLLARMTVGRFRLLHRIGIGAFGVVWKGIDPRLERFVAVKIPHTDRVLTHEDRERFLREARNSASLLHPGIVAVHEVGVHEGVPFLVCEYVEGRTLAQALTEQHFTPNESAQLVAQLAEALHYAHEQGVIHRDVKPSNILLTVASHDRSTIESQNNVPRITDFGLARRLNHEANLTLEGQLLGTPAYMSPEQAQGTARSANRTTDIYSLGVVLYQLLTCTLPFVGDGHAVLNDIMHAEPRAPRQLQERVPRDLEAVCLKCLEKNPLRRYETAHLLAEDLRRVLAGNPTVARPLSSVGRLGKWIHRQPAFASLLTLCTLLAISLIGLNYWRMHELQTAFAEATTLRIAAEAGRAATEQQHLSSRQHLYHANMRLAHELIQRGELTLAHDILREYDISSGESQFRSFEWYYLTRLASTHVDTLTSQGSKVYTLAMSSNGDEIVTGSEDGQLRWWDIRPRPARLFYSTSAHTSCINCIQYSPDGSMIASVSCDKTVKLWDARSKSLLRALETLDMPAFSCAFNADGTRLAVAYGIPHQREDLGGVAICSVATGKIIEQCRNASRLVDALVSSPDGKFFAFGTSDDRLFLHEWATSRESVVSGSDVGRTTGLAFSPDSKLLASNGAVNGVTLWRVPELKYDSRIDNFPMHIQSFSFSSRDRSMILGCHNGAIHLLDPDEYKHDDNRREIKAHQGQLWFAQYLSDGNTAASSAGDGSVKLWLPERWQAYSIIDTHNEPIPYLSFTQGGNHLTAFTNDGARFEYHFTDSGWRSETSKADVTYPNELQSLNDIQVAQWASANAASPDGIILNSTTGREDSGDIAVLSPDAQTLTRITRSQDSQTVQTWDVSSATLRREVKLVDMPPKWYALAPTGLIALVGNDRQPPILWDLTKAQPLSTMRDPPDGAEFAQFSADSRFIAIVGTSRVVIAESSTGRVIHRFAIPSQSVSAIRLSPDGRRLAIGDQSVTSQIHIFDIESGSELVTLTGPHSTIRNLFFRPDGRELFSVHQLSPQASQILVWSGTTQ